MVLYNDTFTRLTALSSPTTIQLISYTNENEYHVCNQSQFFERPPEICIDKQLKLTDTNIITIIVYSIVFFFSFILNILMLVAMKRNRIDQSRIQRFMSHLNIADLIVTLITIPLEIGWKWSVMWLAGDIGCRIFQFLRPLGIYLSSFIIMSLSIDRYYAILNPLSTFAHQRTQILIYLSWILSILCSVPQIFVFSLRMHPVHKWYKQCVTFNIEKRSDTYVEFLFLCYQVFVSLITFFLPLLVIIYTYACIFLKIVNKLEIEHTTSTSAKNNISTDKGNKMLLYSKSRTDRIKKAKIKTLKLSALIIIVFLICWTPYYVISVWFWIDPKSAQKIDDRITNFLFIFAVCHCIANPLVYGLFTMDLRFICGKKDKRRKVERSLMSTTFSHADYNGGAKALAQSMRKTHSCNFEKRHSVATF